MQVTVLTSRPGALGYSRVGMKRRKANALRVRGGNVYVIDREKCVKVGDCVNACPVSAIEDKSEGVFAISEDCTDCGACEPVCDAKAIHKAH